MTGMPPPTRKWMCPVHSEHVLVSSSISLPRQIDIRRLIEHSIFSLSLPLSSLSLRNEYLELHLLSTLKNVEYPTTATSSYFLHLNEHLQKNTKK